MSDSREHSQPHLMLAVARSAQPISCNVARRADHAAILLPAASQQSVHWSQSTADCTALQAGAPLSKASPGGGPQALQALPRGQYSPTLWGSLSGRQGPRLRLVSALLPTTGQPSSRRGLTLCIRWACLSACCCCAACTLAQAAAASEVHRAFVCRHALPGLRHCFWQGQVQAPCTLTHRGMLLQVEWNEQEQHQVEQACSKFPPSKYSPLERCVRIAAMLPRKGVRDVAMRLQWLTVNSAFRVVVSKPQQCAASCSIQHAAPTCCAYEPRVRGAACCLNREGCQVLLRC